MSSGPPSVVLSYVVCRHCGIHIDICICSLFTTTGSQSNGVSQSTPLTPFTSSHGDRNRHDYDASNITLEEPSRPRPTVDVPYQPQPLPPSVLPFGQRPADPLQQFNVEYGQQVSHLLQTHGDQTRREVSAKESLYPPQLPNNIGAFGGIGGQFSQQMLYPPMEEQQQPCTPGPSTTRHPLAERHDRVANPPQLLVATAPQPGESSQGQPGAVSKRDNPRKPGPEWQNMRKMGRAIEKGLTDDDMVCCEWDWVTEAIKQKHLRWHKEVPENSELFCHEHQRGWIKKEDYLRHTQSHAGALRTWAPCPKYGTDGCETIFGLYYAQNVPRHLGNKHGMIDRQEKSNLTHQFKSDTSRHVHACSKDEAKAQVRLQNWG